MKKTLKELYMYTEHKWESDKHFNFSYLKYLPADYDGKKKLPLLLFLHGAGERGEELEVVARHGYLKHIREKGKEYPFIIIAPQCPSGKYWGGLIESLLGFLDYLSEELAVDEERIYLSGLSMGGNGTFLLAMADADRFAAIAPVCGCGIVWYGEALKNLPTLMYHGDLDTIVPISESVTMLTAINKNGGNATLKICNGVGHNAWDIAYEGDELASWLMEHKRSKA